MPAGFSSVSRRTRSQLNVYYEKAHGQIKKKRAQQTNKCHISVEHVNLTSDDNSPELIHLNDSDNEDEYTRKTVGMGGRRNLGRSPKRYVIRSDDDEEEDDDDEEYNIKKRRKVDVKEGRRKPGRQPKKKACQKSGLDAIGILVDSIWKQNKSIDEKPVVVQKKATPLPLKFRFEDNERSFVRDKTDEEKEIESLFRELEIGLWESEVGCTKLSTTNGDDSRFSERGTPCCGRGLDDGVLDEQIGIVCKWCSHVLLDIKYVLPPFFVESPDRREKKHTKETKNSTIYEMQFKASACDNNPMECGINSKGTVLDLISESEKDLYPHQLEGFKFMWKKIAGDIHIKNLKNLSSSHGGGCIISHAPGTGKTRLSIVFLQTFLKLYPNCRPVIIAPCGMLMTWEQEFRKWNVGIDFLNLNEKKLNRFESEAAESLVGLNRDRYKDKDYIRFVKIYSWMKGGSVLGVGYRLFEKLVGEHKKNGSNEKFSEMLLQLPGLLFLDEGHTPRNNLSLMWKSLTVVKTQRRVILSGTPFQNNFDELYNTLSLVNPNFSQETGPLKKKPGRKRKSNGWDYLTSRICERNDTESDQVKKLRSMIKPFIHSHKGDILVKNLPGKKEWLICLRPTDLQSELLRNITQVEKFLDQSHLASLISIHPSLAAKNPAFSAYKTKLSKLESDPSAGVKTRFLIELIKLSTRVSEKVLVFSQNIDPLDHIKELLKSQFSWNEGHEVLVMTGKLNPKQRQCSISSFNDKSSNSKVLLASIKACSEGISLVGASRVVFLDVAWNPSVETQAASRAYRIGQERIVYVYHLVTGMEDKKFARQARKEWISKLIFSEGEKGGRTCGGGGGGGGIEEDMVLNAMVRRKSLSGIFENIVYRPKEANLDDIFVD